MKALSMKQPWGYLVQTGLKTIETRKWKTNYRGDILFVASKKIDSDFFEVVLTNQLININIDLDKLKNPKLGVALCIAELYDIKPMTAEHEASAFCETYPGAYSWFLRNVREVKPFPVTGKLSLFDVEVPL